MKGPADDQKLGKLKFAGFSLMFVGSYGRKAMKSQFESHLKKVLTEIDRHLSDLSYEQLVIDAGNLEYYFADDQSKPFRTTPLFNYLCPVQSEGHAIHYKPGNKPTLHYYGNSRYYISGPLH